MCGICGFIDKKRSGRNLDALIHSMTATIIHRGPDEDGFFIHESVALGMRRLKVIDLVTGTQPVFNETKDITVVYNGEIYNFPEIREELLLKGHTFRTHTDTEVIVHAYEEFGQDCVLKFNGMFAFCLYDMRKRSLFICRDRVGIKPLYYAVTDGCVAFASEIKPLLEIKELSRRLNLSALDEYLTFEYSLAPQTLLSDVQKLPPGCFAVYKDGDFCVKRYWRISQQPFFTDRERCKQELRETLSASVKRMLISDVPLGVFLSGGIDSSIMVGLMAQHAQGRIKTFSIGFKNQSYNELPYARLIARRYNTEHYESIIDADLSGFMGQFIEYLDEPMADVSIFPTFLISREARKEVTVVLSGDGGDELFGGYDTYLAQKLHSGLYSRIPRVVRNRLFAGLAAAFRPTAGKKGVINRLKRFTQGDRLPQELLHYRWMVYLSELEKQQLYSGELLNSLHNQGAYKALLQNIHEFEGFDALNQLMLVDFHVYLPEDILTKVDRMSMAVSLESRVPYLDHTVVELAYRIPGDWKINGNIRKAILKEACTDLLPDEIMRKPKEGFSIPLKNWLRNELKDTMYAVLTDRSFLSLNLFNEKRLAHLIDEHVRGRQNYAHNLWPLMVFAMWHKRYIG